LYREFLNRTFSKTGGSGSSERSASNNFAPYWQDEKDWHYHRSGLVDALPCGFGWYKQSLAVFQFLFSEVSDIPKT